MKRLSAWQRSFQGMKKIKPEEKVMLDFTHGSCGEVTLAGRGPIGLLRWWKAARNNRERIRPRH